MVNVGRVSSYLGSLVKTKGVDIIVKEPYYVFEERKREMTNEETIR